MKFCLVILFLLALPSLAREELTASDHKFQLKRKEAHSYMRIEEHQSQGINLFHQLIDWGDPYAAEALATYYIEGYVKGFRPAQAIEEAIKIFEKGVKLNQPRAIQKLAQLHIQTDFRFLSGPKTLELLEIGRQLKDRNCICILASLYRQKEFCEKWQISQSFPLIVQLYQEACDLKCEVAPCELATLYINYELDWIDPIKAYFVLNPLLQKGDNRARQVWENAKKKIPHKTMINLLENLEKGDANSYYYIGKAYQKGWYGIKPCEKEAEKYWNLALKKNNKEKPLYQLISLYLNQKSSFYNMKKVYELLAVLYQQKTYLGYYYWAKVQGRSPAEIFLQFYRWLDNKKKLTYLLLLWSLFNQEV
jgi:hypothetical protein